MEMIPFCGMSVIHIKHAAQFGFDVFQVLRLFLEEGSCCLFELVKQCEPALLKKEL